MLWMTSLLGRTLGQFLYFPLLGLRGSCFPLVGLRGSYSRNHFFQRVLRPYKDTTALEYAIQLGTPDMVEVLKDAGANAN